MVITKQLINAIKNQYELNWDGVHGIYHWARVYTNGMLLAELTGADKTVIAFFSVFHDSRRLNEGKDFNHGHRGAELAEEFYGKYFEISPDKFDLLKAACSHHTNSRTHPDVTVKTCFDADRLDLARVGMIPDPRFLCTDAAKDMIGWGIENSILGDVSDIVMQWG